MSNAGKFLDALVAAARPIFFPLFPVGVGATVFYRYYVHGVSPLSVVAWPATVAAERVEGREHVADLIVTDDRGARLVRGAPRLFFRGDGPAPILARGSWQTPADYAATVLEL